MERIGVRELRQHASLYLGRVKAGESIEVAERGKVVALLVPPDDKKSGLLDQLIAEGKIRPPTAPWRLPSPITLPPGSPSASEILEELREERLP